MQSLFLSELSQNSRHTFSTSINQTINQYFIENWQTAAKPCGIGAFDSCTSNWLKINPGCLRQTMYSKEQHMICT